MDDSFVHRQTVNGNIVLECPATYYIVLIKGRDVLKGRALPKLNAYSGGDLIYTFFLTTNRRQGNLINCLCNIFQMDYDSVVAFPCSDQLGLYPCPPSWMVM